MTQFESVALPPRLPLIVETSNRAGSVDQDARLVNCYIEISKQQEIFIYRRPGLTSLGVIADGQVGRGLFFWKGSVYSIFGSVLYKDGVSVGTGLNTTTAAQFNNGVYSFSEYLGATPKLVLMNGDEGYTYSIAGGVSATLNSINVDYPATTVKGAAYLNGATYVMQPQAVIWNSVVNSVDQPGDWSPINFISAQIEPDPGVFLSKQLVYIVAFNAWSTEVFFDAGNAVGSPLGPVQGSKSSYGCANQDSVQRIDDKLFWVVTNQTASLQVGMMDQLSVTIISTPSIDKLLENINYDLMFSWQLKMDGHSFYIITFKNSNLTLAYDIVFDEWHQWTDTNGNYFPIVASTYDASGNRIVQHETNGRLYYITSNSYKDLNDPIQVDIYTPTFDASTRRRKHLNIMTFIGDQVEGSVLNVRYTEDDYKSWGQFRQVDLGAKNPILINCGTFTKRAYNLRHTKDCFFRLQAIEVQYDIGVL